MDPSTTSSNQIKAVIFAQGRTGSSLLESLLCSTGYFTKNGELLNKNKKDKITRKKKGEIPDPLGYIRELSALASPSNFIFHVKIYHLTSRAEPINPSEFLKALSIDGWKIIYLRRRNKINHVLSNLIAKQRGSFKKLDDKEESFNLSINKTNLVNRVKQRFKHEESELHAIEGLDYLEINYEDDLENSASHQLTINKVLDYLSLPHRSASTELRKVNKQAQKDIILNYDEFVECLVENGWQEFLSD